MPITDHENDPERRLPRDGQLEWQRGNEVIDDDPCDIAVCPDLRHARPDVVGRVEVVPAHLVDADGQSGFQRLVDAALQQAGQAKLVDEEHGSVPEVENERMSQLLRLQHEGRVTRQQIEEALVQREGLVKILQRHTHSQSRAETEKSASAYHCRTQSRTLVPAVRFGACWPGADQQLG